ncbi:MAG: hypothetical protein ACHQFW_11605 [Chitinophagales bacterium]
MKKIIISALIVLIVGSLFTWWKFEYSNTLAETTSGLNGYIQQKNCDILFVGSSQTRQDYNIKIIDSICGVSGFCLAYNGLQPILAAEIIDYLTTEYFKPAIIIMEAYPYLSVQEPRLADTRVFTDAPPELKNNIIDLLDDNGDLNFNERFELLVRSGNAPILMSFITAKTKNEMSYKGSYQNKFVKGMQQEFLLNSEDTLSLKTPSLNEYQNKSHQRLAEICIERGIKLIYIQPPVAAPIKFSNNYRSASEQLQYFISQELNVVYIDDIKSFSSFDHQNFSDYYHLSTTGRDTYSILVAELLKSRIN